MNVIDGQASLVIYASLIFYSLTIDNILNIIVLLILAGVTIATLTGENGILTKATEAKEQNEIGKEKEAIGLAWQSLRLDRQANNRTDPISDIELKNQLVTDGEDSNNVDVTGTEKLTVKYKDSGNSYTIDQDGKIENGIETGEGGENTTPDGVKVPAGFVYVGGKKESGIVISDNTEDKDKYKGKDVVGTDVQGNQYVWIPVDGILGEDGSIDDVTGSEKKILLGKYEFDESGIPSVFSGRDEEDLGYGNTVAKDIDEFISSVKTNGGYYIARFEASDTNSDGKSESKYDKVVNELTQPNAAIACRDLYTGLNSDLVNGYAWDTAILFIQKYGENDYSRENGGSTTSKIANTGKNLLKSSNKEDVQLNIYDMGGNCLEWTTETGSSDYPCAYRGGFYAGYRDYYTAGRFGYKTTSDLSFRSILYL